MLGGFYTAAAAMMNSKKRLTCVSNNIANMKTPGYRPQETILTSFDQILSRQENGNSTPIGTVSLINQIDTVYSSFDVNFIQETNRPLDFAIGGNGYFVLMSEDGEEHYTRNGNFTLDEEHYLVGADGSRVQGEGGDIQIMNENFTTLENGEMFDDQGVMIDKIRLVEPEFDDDLVMMNNGMFVLRDENFELLEGTAAIYQRKIEGSQVDFNQEMTTAMAEQRYFQACSTALKQLDQINAKAANEVGKL